VVTESTQAQQQDYLLAQGNLTESTRQALVTASATNDAAARRLASDNRQRVARKAQVFLDTDARSKHDLPPIDSPTFGAKNALFLKFPYVCPEPVLAKWSFHYA